jgi:endonuclease YncB( thermonuclease family)
MFLQSGSLSASSRHGVLALAAVTFALGVAAGSALTSTAGHPNSATALPPAVPAAASRAQFAIRAVHPADVLRVLDGDTFEARVHVWPGLDVTTKVRLRGIDAPELKGKCSEERAKAEAARNALSAILAQGEVGISQVGLDKFGGRVDATASTKTTPDVSTALLQAGLARSYDGGRRAGWCGS